MAREDDPSSHPGLTANPRIDDQVGRHRRPPLIRSRHRPRDLLSTFLLVSIDAVTFALPAPEVVEVVRAVAITRLPGCPASVEGIVNVRGQPLPVYDLRRRFGLSPSAVSPEEHFIVVSAGSRGQAIIRVTRALDLRPIEPEAMASAERSNDPIVSGLVRLPDGLLFVCDLAAFLSDLEAEQLVSALGTPEPT